MQQCRLRRLALLQQRRFLQQQQVLLPGLWGLTALLKGQDIWFLAVQKRVPACEPLGQLLLCFRMQALAVCPLTVLPGSDLTHLLLAVHGDVWGWGPTSQAGTLLLCTFVFHKGKQHASNPYIPDKPALGKRRADHD
jgi:hypothetical protein